MDPVERRETNRWVCDTIENEGLAYAILDYTDSKDFVDRETARLWDEAEAALKALTKHLEDSGCEDVGS